MPAELPATRLLLLLGARGVGAYSGGDLGWLFGGGAEAGVAMRWSGGAVARVRLAGEVFANQSIETARVEAEVGRFALRAGLDGGFASGAHAWLLGVSAGADVVRLEPSAVRDPALSLAGATTSTAPVLRAEARYELSVSSLVLSLSLFGDVSLVDTHYDIVEGGQAERVAEPWPVRPGLAISVGWGPVLAGS